MPCGLPLMPDSLIRLHGRQFVATGIEKMEAAAARKTEDRFGDSRTRRGDSFKKSSKMP